jgi:hypothetical protein
MGVDRPALPAWTEQESREEQAVSRSESTDVARTDADWVDPVVSAADKGNGWGQAVDRDRPSRALQYSDSYARKRAHDSTTSHLTPEPTPARRHEGTADQMACQFAPLEHDERGAATADGFAIFVPAHHPSRLWVDELTTRVELQS